MKHSIFSCLFLTVALFPAFSADNLDVSASVAYSDGAFSAALLNHFPHLESAERKWQHSAALSLDFGKIGIAAGNLKKPGTLSRFNYPVPYAFSSTGVASALAPSTMGAKAAFPSSAGNYPQAFSVSSQLPKKMSGEFFGFEQTFAGQISVPIPIINVKKTFWNVNASCFSYVLSPDDAECEKSWFLKKPNFAEQRCASFLVETQFRSRDFKTVSPLVFYAAAGFSESPFSGYNFWLRNESSVTINKVFTLKERFFFAPSDFYTAETRLVGARYSYSLNPLFYIAGNSIASASIGFALSYDSSTDFYSVRAAAKTALQQKKVAIGLHFASGFDNFNKEQLYSAVAWAEAGFATHLRYVSGEATFKYKCFLASSAAAEKEVVKGKDEYVVSVNVVPETKNAKNLSGIPSLHASADFTVKNGSVKCSLENTLRWKIATKTTNMNFAVKYIHSSS